MKDSLAFVLLSLVVVLLLLVTAAIFLIVVSLKVLDQVEDKIDLMCTFNKEKCNTVNAVADSCKNKISCDRISIFLYMASTRIPY